MFESLLEELPPLAAHGRIKGLLANETALVPALLPLTPSLVGLLSLLLESPFVGQHHDPVLMFKLIEPAGMTPVLQAQMDSREVGLPSWAQEFFAVSATSSSLGAKLARFSLTASKPAWTTSDADAPCSRRCSYAASPKAGTAQR